MGLFGYADDLSLLCPSFTGIKEMLNICEKYARKYDVKIMQQKVNNYIVVKIVIMITCSQF